MGALAGLMLVLVCAAASGAQPLFYHRPTLDGIAGGGPRVPGTPAASPGALLDQWRNGLGRCAPGLVARLSPSQLPAASPLVPSVPSRRPLESWGCRRPCRGTAGLVRAGTACQREIRCSQPPLQCPAARVKAGIHLASQPPLPLLVVPLLVATVKVGAEEVWLVSLTQRASVATPQGLGVFSPIPGNEGTVTGKGPGLHSTLVLFASSLRKRRWL